MLFVIRRVTTPLLKLDVTPHGAPGLLAYASAAFVAAVPSSLSGVRWILTSWLGDGRVQTGGAPRGVGREGARAVLTDSAGSPGAREQIESARVWAQESATESESAGASEDCT